MSFEDFNSPKVNQHIIRVLRKTVVQLEAAYKGKARSFAVILNEFDALVKQLNEKLDLHSSVKGEAGHHVSQDSKKKVKEKKVYVRIFHRNMDTLLSPTASLNWMRPLLESVKHAEKHGLAVYANEDDIKRSLKGSGYGYLTIKISEEQDISSQRPQRYDNVLNCPLLVITDVTTDNFVKFSYDDIDFPIKNGILYRPKKLSDQDKY